MSILIIGSKGNMASRYKCILDTMGYAYRGIDVDTDKDIARKFISEASGIIIATPTKTHVDIIKSCVGMRVPILCEKPVTKNIGELKDILDEIKDEETPFRMIYQYSILVDKNDEGHSIYNYFKHGGDGLAWDCIQIIGLSKGVPTLKEDSPVWHCVINGKKLNIADMDYAYMQYIRQWLQKPSQDLGEILDIHEKTAEIDRGQSYGLSKRSNWDTSALN